MRALLVVTTDGFAKRVPLEQVVPRRRGAKGVRISSVPVAAVIATGDGADDGDLVLATANGNIERIAVSKIPIRKRSVRSGGRISKGVVAIKLAGGDCVASAALAPPTDPLGVAHCHPAALRGGTWPWGRAGLREGERIGAAVIFRPPRPLDQIQTGGRPVVPRDEWAQTDVHRASSYFCAHCGQRYAHPDEVHACVDAHADAAKATIRGPLVEPERAAA